MSVNNTDIFGDDGGCDGDGSGLYNATNILNDQLAEVKNMFVNPSLDLCLIWGFSGSLAVVLFVLLHRGRRKISAAPKTVSIRANYKNIYSVGLFILISATVSLFAWGTASIFSLLRALAFERLLGNFMSALEVLVPTGFGDLEELFEMFESGLVLPEADEEVDEGELNRDKKKRAEERKKEEERKEKEREEERKEKERIQKAATKQQVFEREAAHAVDCVVSPYAAERTRLVSEEDGDVDPAGARGASPSLQNGPPDGNRRRSYHSRAFEVVVPINEDTGKPHGDLDQKEKGCCGTAFVAGGLLMARQSMILVPAIEFVSQYFESRGGSLDEYAGHLSQLAPGVQLKSLLIAVSAALSCVWLVLIMGPFTRLVSKEWCIVSKFWTVILMLFQIGIQPVVVQRFFPPLRDFSLVTSQTIWENCIIIIEMVAITHLMRSYRRSDFDLARKEEDEKAAQKKRRRQERLKQKKWHHEQKEAAFKAHMSMRGHQDQWANSVHKATAFDVPHHEGGPHKPPANPGHVHDANTMSHHQQLQKAKDIATAFQNYEHH